MPGRHCAVVNCGNGDYQLQRWRQSTCPTHGCKYDGFRAYKPHATPRRAYSQPPAISNADERVQTLSASISVIYIRISCHGMFGCRVSYRRIETQSVRVSRHFVNCIHKRCTDCRPIIGNSLHVRLRSFCCNRHYVFASSVGACCPSSTVSASVSRYRQGFMQDFISGV